jgi:hypothetical protein
MTKKRDTRAENRMRFENSQMRARKHTQRSFVPGAWDLMHNISSCDPQKMMSLSDKVMVSNLMNFWNDNSEQFEKSYEQTVKNTR